MIVKAPSAPVDFSLMTLVSWFTTLTLASGTLDPDASTTLPFTTAVGVWGSKVALGTKNARRSTTTATRSSFISNLQIQLGTSDFIYSHNYSANYFSDN